MDGNSSTLPSDRVWQAQAIVAEETDCPLHAALTFMKERAQRDGRTLEEVAVAVLAGQIDFG
jgi:hypothetical protein